MASSFSQPSIKLEASSVDIGKVEIKDVPAVALSSDDIADTSKAIYTGSFLHGFDGTDWQRLRCTTAKVLETALKAYDGANWQNLEVQSATYKNVKTSLWEADRQAEVTSGATDDRAQTKIGMLTGARLYALFGTNWQRLRCDTNKNLLIAVNAALPAGANLIGKVRLSDGSLIITHYPNSIDSRARDINCVPTMASLYAADVANMRAIKTDTDGGLWVKVVTALPTGTNKIGKVELDDRPWEQGTPGQLSNEIAGGGNTSITPTNDLYLTSILLHCVGYVTLRDGGVAGTFRARIEGDATDKLRTMQFNPPLKFSTDLFIVGDAGNAYKFALSYWDA